MIRSTFTVFIMIAGVAIADDATVHFPPPSAAVPVTPEVRDWPMSVDVAVSRMISEMSDEAKAAIRSMPEADLAKLHHSVGKFIRNRFGLWSGNADLLKDSGAGEPDAASMVIIQALWKRLNQK